MSLITEFGIYLKLEILDDSLAKDKEIVLAIVSDYGHALKDVDDSLKRDKEIVLAAVANDGSALKYADASLKKDREIVLSAVKQNGDALNYADDSLKKDKDFMLKVVSINGDYIKFADKTIQDMELVVAAIKTNSIAFRYLNTHIIKKIKDKKEALDLIKTLKNYHEVYELINIFDSLFSDNLRDDDELMFELVTENYNFSQFLSDRLKNDKEFAIKCINVDGCLFNHFSDEVKDDDKVSEIAMSKWARNYDYLTLKQKQKKEYIIAALKYDAWNYKYVPEELRGDSEIIALAEKKPTFVIYAPQEYLENKDNLNRYIKSVNWDIAPEKLKNEFDVMAALVKYEKSYSRYDFKHFHIKYRMNKKIIIEALKEARTNYSDIIKYVPTSILEDRAIVLSLAKINGNIIGYVDKSLLDDEICMAAMKKGLYDDDAYNALTDKFKNNKEFIIKQYKKSPINYFALSKELQDDVDIKKAYHADKITIIYYWYHGYYTSHEIHQIRQAINKKDFKSFMEIYKLNRKGLPGSASAYNDDDWVGDLDITTEENFKKISYGESEAG